MRIAVGQIWQETNTFNRNPTTFGDFENWGVALGDAVLDEYGDVGEIGGFVAGCRDALPDAEFAGLARFACWPWGPVAGDAWQRIQETFRAQLQAAGRIDAVFLALHGAMTAEGEPDLTGAILQLVRDTVGPDVPIVGTLDLHANITPRMMSAANVLSGYHACPHVDTFETGRRAATALCTMVREDLRPVHIWKKLPMVTPAEHHNTFTGVPAPLYRLVEQWEAEPDVLSAGLYMAMPWCDVPELGWAVTLTLTRRSPRWKAAVNELADQCWEVREAMCDVERFTPDEAVEQALSCPGYPVVIGDGADATNSGSPGDQTHLLRAFLKRGSLPRQALTFLVDPEAVATARQAGQGATFDGMVGAAFAPEYCEPVRLRGVVERLLNVEYILDGHIGHNLPIRMGAGAVIRSGDVCVLLVEKTGPGSTPRLYETADLDPRAAGIVVAKSPAGFRAEYDAFAAATLLADCPGCASPHLERLNYYQANRPLWPLNRIDRPQEAPWSGELRQ